MSMEQSTYGGEIVWLTGSWRPKGARRDFSVK
jgi:hypothetical protein